MKKARIPIPPEIAAGVLHAADKTCCVCEEKGKAVQIHHLDEDPANNDPTNLAVLCLQCHNDTQVRGGFGRQLDAAVVREYWRKWVDRVSVRRQRSDDLSSMRALPIEKRQSIVPPGADADPPTESSSYRLATIDSLADYIARLPELRALAYEEARNGWGGSTYDMMEASYQVIDTYVGVLVRLARWYPKNHFGPNPKGFFEDRVRALFDWHRLRLEAGPPPHGTIIGPQAAGAVMRDTETMIVDLVDGLQSLETPYEDWKAWLAEWERAGKDD